MSTTSRDMRCTPAAVFAVLGDGWLFGLWVVGASRIRQVDHAWPARGSSIHHSVGTWPLLLDDTTTVTAYEPELSIGLRARGWPAGEAQVTVSVEPTAAGCRVSMVEDAVKGPGLAIPKPIRDAALHWRNVEALRRLSYLAEGRSTP